MSREDAYRRPCRPRKRNARSRGQKRRQQRLRIERGERTVVVGNCAEEEDEVEDNIVNVFLGENGEEDEEEVEDNIVNVVCEENAAEEEEMEFIEIEEIVPDITMMSGDEEERSSGEIEEIQIDRNDDDFAGKNNYSFLSPLSPSNYFENCMAFNFAVNAYRTYIVAFATFLNVISKNWGNSRMPSPRIDHIPKSNFQHDVSLCEKLCLHLFRMPMVA